MLRALLVVCTVLFAAIAAAAPSSAWPTLRGGDRTDQCDTALQIARYQFASDTPYVFAPPTIPSGIDSVEVLGTRLVDVSGGDALFADEAIFERIPAQRSGTEMRAVWQRAPVHDRRFVLVERPMGWRGDRYFVFDVTGATTLVEVLAQVDAPRPSNGVIPLLSGVWRPPLVFRHAASGTLWFVDLDAHTSGVLPNWNIYAAGPDGTGPRCSVHFWPEVADATDLLPERVRELARLLDQSLGNGVGEGTLQPTARIRGTASNTWANAAYRPWAVTAAYNTRAEVDAGLKVWSKKNALRYEQILKLYPLAEKSLSDYYEKTFTLSPEDARALASYVLDVAFRSNFVFSSDDPERLTRNAKASRNPWRTFRP